MTIEVKLFATLRKHLPEGGDGKSTRIDLPCGSRITDVLDALEIPHEQAQLVLVDGKHMHDHAHPLDVDCTVSVFPALAGGC